MQPEVVAVEYLGFSGLLYWEPDENTYFGSARNNRLRSLVTFESNTVEGAIEEFKKSVEISMENLEDEKHG